MRACHHIDSVVCEHCAPRHYTFDYKPYTYVPIATPVIEDKQKPYILPCPYKVPPR